MTDLLQDIVMHRFNGPSLRPAAVLLLAVAVGLLVSGRAAAAPEAAGGPAAGRSAAVTKPAGYAPYLSVGLGTIRPQDTRFADGKDTGNAALYGSADRFDAGAFGSGLQARIAAGLRTPSGFRVQLEAGLARGLGFRGNANYRNAGRRQPSAAEFDTWHLLLAGFYDFPAWTVAPGRAVRPFLGAGAGLTGYRLSGYVQRFPDPDDPGGYLRRGPGGAVPLTAIPGGRGRNFTWMLTAGIALPVLTGVHLDLGYRYTDAGRIRTGIGDITIVRYRENGARPEIRVQINETSARFRTHSLLAALRFDF